MNGRRTDDPGTAVEVGYELPGRDVTITRTDLVRYAAASGDLNPIHWNERVAVEAGLPGVIAHGMFTMALAAQFVVDWAGGPGTLATFSTRFTKPVVVPDDDAGVTVAIGATVKAVEDGAVTLAVSVKADGKAVLGKAVAEVRPTSS